MDHNDIELSCSTIIPGDVHTWARTNYTGKIGIVIRPNKIKSITYASPADAGSQIDPTNPKRRYTGLPQATVDIIRSAILGRCPDRYNELGVMDYTVMGVFIDPPVEFTTPNGDFQSIGVEEVLAKFSDQRLLCLREGSLYEICRIDGHLSCGQKIDVPSLYT